eukprot:10283396-Alexandrium_andersonii.AAC.1
MVILAHPPSATLHERDAWCVIQERKPERMVPIPSISRVPSFSGDESSHLLSLSDPGRRIPVDSQTSCSVVIY